MEAAEVGIIDGGARKLQVVVLPIPPLVVTMIGVIAYVDVRPAPTERVGNEQVAPLAVNVRSNMHLGTESTHRM